jgi:hypothetical protein
MASCHQTLEKKSIPNYKIKQKWVKIRLILLYRNQSLYCIGRSLIWKGPKPLYRFKLVDLEATYTLQRLNMFKVLKLCPFIYSNWWILTIAPLIEIYFYEGNCVLCRFIAPKWRIFQVMHHFFMKPLSSPLLQV